MLFLACQDCQSRISGSYSLIDWAHLYLTAASAPLRAGWLTNRSIIQFKVSAATSTHIHTQIYNYRADTPTQTHFKFIFYSKSTFIEFSLHDSNCGRFSSLKIKSLAGQSRWKRSLIKSIKSFKVSFFHRFQPEMSTVQPHRSTKLFKWVIYKSKNTFMKNEWLENWGYSWSPQDGPDWALILLQHPII